MILLALCAFGIGAVGGFMLGRRLMLRALAGLILGLTLVIVAAALAPLPDGVAIGFLGIYLIAGPLASGLFTGAIVSL